MSLGHPGSGKTYFTKRLAQKQGFVRLNADALRMNMFGSFDAARQFDVETKKLGQVMFKALDTPTPDEHVIEIDGLQTFENQYRSFTKQLKQIKNYARK